MKLKILVPVNNAFGIVKGSAIIYQEKEDGLHHVYYVYGASNLKEFDDKLLVAGYRLKDNAPTVAKEVLPDNVFRGAFKVVGEYELLARQKVIYSQQEFEDWAGSVE